MMSKRNIVSVQVGGGKDEVRGKEPQISYDKIEVVKMDFPNFASMVLEEEAADDSQEESDVCARLRELDYFSPVRGMANIRQVFDDKLFAQIYVDEKSMRFVEFCQKNNDGTYSPMIRLPQAGMRMAAQYHFTSKGIAEPAIRSRVAAFIVGACDEYYGKSPFEEEMDIAQILNVLYRVMPKLPIKPEVPMKQGPEEFYRRVLRNIGDLQTMILFPHESYYMFDEDGIEKLAYRMDMKRLELLRQLKKYDFLYLTDSSDGYQTNARFTDKDGKSFTQWVYCIFKLQFFAGIEEKKETVPIC